MLYVYMGKSQTDPIQKRRKSDCCVLPAAVLPEKARTFSLETRERLRQMGEQQHAPAAADARGEAATAGGAEEGAMPMEVEGGGEADAAASVPACAERAAAARNALLPS